MKLFGLFLLSFVIQAAYGQVNAVKLDKKSIPATIQYAGKIIDAVKYTDADGDHIVLTTETGITDSKGKDSDGLRDAELYACNYVVKDGKAVLLWQVHDFSKDCGVDVLAAYIPGTFAVTDLNKDGKAEVWLMYRTACRGDVSPAVMKIIMYEGGKKYAIRGTARVKLSEKETYGGKYTLDEAFLNGPKVFKEFASLLWQKNLLDKFN